MARFVLIGFLLLPLAEIATFIAVGQRIGLFPTLGLVILSAVAGGLLLRHQGLSVVQRMRSSMNSGTLPGQTVFDTMAIGLAALLLILPGFLSDLVALILLLPPVRQWLYRSLAGRVRVVETTTSYRRSYPDDDPQLGRPGTIDLDDDKFRRD